MILLRLSMSYFVYSSNSTCSICCGFVVQVVRLVVKLWICCGFDVYSFRFVEQLFDLWTSRKPYSTVSICCGCFVKLTTNLQHLDMSRCCGFVEKLGICRGFVVDPQQVEIVEFELIYTVLH
jgi:hypothetical protein